MLSALQVLAAAWSLLLAGALLEARLGECSARFLSIGAAAGLVIAARPARRAQPASRLGLSLALGLAAGFASYPMWIAAVAALGRCLGLAPVAQLAPASDVLHWMLAVLLAPLLEELLYRERLLEALRERMGAAAAVALSSAAFAAAHPDPWAALTTFLLGLLLGTAARLGGSVAPCIGVHAGLNAAAIAGGLPPARNALPPPLAALVGSVALAAALWAARWRPARGPGRSLAARAPPPQR